MHGKVDGEQAGANNLHLCKKILYDGTLVEIQLKLQQVNYYASKLTGKTWFLPA